MMANIKPPPCKCANEDICLRETTKSTMPDK
ncbi:hypothetical protein AVEN_27320-1, partial [Araneus ventricosus]